VDVYSRRPPEEQRIIVVTLLAAAGALWLAVAWEEVTVLLALPILAITAWAMLRLTRKRAERHEQEIPY